MDKNVSAVVFDFDDTLADTAFVYAHLVKKLDAKGETYGIKNLGKLFMEADIDLLSIARKTKDVSLFDRHRWIDYIAVNHSFHLTKKQKQEIVKFYWNVFYDYMRPMPYAKKVLAILAKKYKLLLLSDPDGDARIKMKRIAITGLTRFFDGFILGDVLNTTKPSKKYYDYIKRKYKIDLKKSIMVGDNPGSDLILAKKLGMTTVWMKHGRWAVTLKNRKFRYVDYTITDLRQLLKRL